MTASEKSTDRPLRADAERNKQRLIAAAQEVYAERGVEVTLDDIARHAGVGIGTAYRRFADHAELIDAAFESEVRQMIALAEAALTHQDPWEGVVQLLLTTGEHVARNRGLREVLVNRRLGRDRVAAAREQLTPAVNAVFTRAQQAGHLRDDLEVTDFPFIQMMIGATAEHSRDVAPELWRRYLTVLLDGLRPARNSPTPLAHRALDPQEFDQTMV
ncbi:TetR/AcrR family transcriptional regulator [Nonomuraea soli]|uniref:AcrR family transcriptional regulator n=1 Tax=Nonomuraea soli TaxID=1032476 RepID=A0A7W0CFC9_9ACTN|nr:TetR family transcriptional regulator [Nonomuraea soli]MBA2890071.1 AcrR family transcriptional regulator [Nonomuraea soli]